MTPTVASIWVYLSASPLLWLTATLSAYVAADMISARLGRHPLANPVVIAAAALVGLLLATGTDYAAYFEGAQFVHFLLGPATVALAIPLWRNLALVRRALLPMAAALLAGSVTAAASAVAIAWAFGAPSDVLASLAPKSTTAPIAMELSKSLGGIPALTAVLVVLTGITGAVIVTPLMNALKITDFAARGFAAGVASHGIGTARAFQVSEIAGTFAGIAMGLNGALTSLLVLLWLALVG
jgi:predicted murein hydrolase (TIGR00659 family)